MGEIYIVAYINDSLTDGFKETIALAEKLDILVKVDFKEFTVDVYSTSSVEELIQEFRERLKCWRVKYVSFHLHEHLRFNDIY